MGCQRCNREAVVSKSLKVCVDCIRDSFSEVKRLIEAEHRERPRGGIKCKVCVNECKIPEGERGYCGIRENRDGKLRKIADGVVSWYYDALPTNCVAEWVCRAKEGYNLAVFYEACSFDCLFCQNWHYRYGIARRDFHSPKELSDAVNDSVHCICYFGGDPTPQIEHAIEASELAIEKKPVKICWETNGSMNRVLLKRAAELSLRTGGCIKFDLKAYNENLHYALTGCTNRRTLENFEYIANSFDRENFLIASTLLVPGYIDEEEIENIAGFIASLNPSIPYSLLAFCPHFKMSDLPTTSRVFAERAFYIAKERGLYRVKIGNVHLLS
jgi:pyruvate formate lyase activating enzyme